MTKLSVNLNKVALLRNQRETGRPGVLHAARAIIDAGAHGVTVHPRPDERHIRRSDVSELADMLASEYDNTIEFNIEGNPFPDFMELIDQVRPHQATLVPDSPEAATSDHGWDIPAHADRLTTIINDLHNMDARVSLFVDGDADHVRQAHEVGADRVELYTGPYAEAYGTAEDDAMFARYCEAAEAARDLDVGLNAGHDLDLVNLARFQQAMPWLAEVSIGHAFTADALIYGFADTVRRYLAALGAA
jgi:pyridoxine 5-phosphate synthase